MSVQTMSEVERGFERLFRDGTLAGPNDNELLERFLVRQDGAAFDALLERHGPMVRAVCRRGLTDPGAADDAFQATFLVLIRHARTVRSARSLGGWLHRVACRVVAKSAAADAHRRRKEMQAMPAKPREHAEPDEVAILHEEIARLPETYRTPLVLFHLEGLPAAAVADRLGCLEGTVWARLSRARNRLRTRLARRGVGPAAVLLGKLPELAHDSLPPALVASTHRLGIAALRGGRSLAKVASPAVLELTHAASGTFGWSHVGVGLFATAMALATGGLIALGGRKNEEAPVAKSSAPGAGSASAPSPRAEPRLPEGCEPLDRKTAPDGRQVAFVGRYTPPVAGAAMRSGLFVVDLGTKSVRQLIDDNLQTTTAWSPDSRKLAIGNSPGYGNKYPLVIVDVATGALDTTGVQGGGPAWSPDGRYIAVSTGFHQGGSWSGGVPVDGHIGLYDTQTRRLVPLTPAGYNLHDARAQRSAMRGAIRPIWSPDGKRLAFELWTRSTEGETTKETRDVWVVDRDGKNLRRGLAGSTTGASWSADGETLTIEGSKEWPGGRVNLAQLPIEEPGSLSQPPPALADGLRASAAAKTRAETFDLKPILAANRAWQNPTFEHLKSVQFVHKMEPNKLDERFIWRRDGAMLFEVLRYGGASPEEHVGRIKMMTPGGSEFSFGPGSHYPSIVTKNAGELRSYALDHLTGTRVHFVALALGRDPSAFVRLDVRRAEDGKTIVVDVAPIRTRERSRFGLNAGAMFETSSRAYVHDLHVEHAELTIDAATQRIVREVDYGFKGEKLCEIDLSDWVEIGAGGSVPQRVRFRFPGQSFTVEDRFTWHPERLWLLSSGESQFDGNAPERESIAELAINAPTPVLDAALERSGKASNALDAAPSVKAERVSIITSPFLLGEKLPLAGDRFESLTFTFHTDRANASETVRRWDWPTLRAIVTRKPSDRTGDAIVLVLYDQEGRPVGSAYAALGAGNADLVLDLGGFRSLGSAKTWSLSLIAKDSAQAVVSLAHGGKTDVNTFAVTPGKPEVIQVETVPDWPAPSKTRGDMSAGTTRVRSFQSRANADGLVDAAIEVVSRNAWKELAMKTTVVLLDDHGVPIAAGNVAREFRVYQDVYDAADVPVPLQGFAPQGRVSRAVIGAQTVVVGAPMGSLWGRLGSGETPYPIESLLGGDDPEVWRRGVAALDSAVNVESRRGNRRADGSADLDEKSWGAIHRILRPHAARLAALVPKARTAGPGELARLCLLLGYAGDPQLIEPLKAQVEHPDDRVRDAAAIGLGLLGDRSSRNRLESIVARPDPPDAVAKSESDWLKLQATRAISVLER